MWESEPVQRCGSTATVANTECLSANWHAMPCWATQPFAVIAARHVRAASEAELAEFTAGGREDIRGKLNNVICM